MEWLISNLPITSTYCIVWNATRWFCDSLNISEQSVSSDTMWHDSSSLAVDATLLNSSEPICTQHQSNSVHSSPNREYPSITLISSKSQRLVLNIGIIGRESDQTTRWIRKAVKIREDVMNRDKGSSCCPETRDLPAVPRLWLTILGSYNSSDSYWRSFRSKRATAVAKTLLIFR